MVQKGGCDGHDGQLASGFTPRKGDNQPRSLWILAGLQTPTSPGKGQPDPRAGVCKLCCVPGAARPRKPPPGSPHLCSPPSSEAPCHSSHGTKG